MSIPTFSCNVLHYHRCTNKHEDIIVLISHKRLTYVAPRPPPHGQKEPATACVHLEDALSRRNLLRAKTLRSAVERGTSALRELIKLPKLRHSRGRRAGPSQAHQQDLLPRFGTAELPEPKTNNSAAHKHTRTPPHTRNIRGR